MNSFYSFRRLLLAATFVLVPAVSAAAPNDFARQQQEQQRRQEQERERERERERQREQQRQQQQEQLRQQQRLEQQRQQQEALRQQARQEEQRRLQNQNKQQQRGPQQEQQNAQRAAQTGKPAQPSNLPSRSNDRMTFSNGVTKLTRPLTPAEIKRGFTGKFTSDGRALVKFQNRIFTVPAARVGFNLRASTSPAALTSRWSTQQQSAFHSDIRNLLGGSSSSGPSGSGIPPMPNSVASRIAAASTFKTAGVDTSQDALKPSLSQTFNKTATVTRFDYNKNFEESLAKDFKPGYIRFSGPLNEELIIVQFHRGDRSVGVGRTLAWWTPHTHAKTLKTEDEIRNSLALPKDWGPRDTVSIARIPKGTVIEYAKGYAAQKEDEDGTVYSGGGEQLRFREFDPAWLVGKPKKRE